MIRALFSMQIGHIILKTRFARVPVHLRHPKAQETTKVLMVVIRMDLDPHPQDPNVYQIVIMNQSNLQRYGIYSPLNITMTQWLKKFQKKKKKNLSESRQIKLQFHNLACFQITKQKFLDPGLPGQCPQHQNFKGPYEVKIEQF